MHLNLSAAVLLALSAVTEAWVPPQYADFNRLWSSPFDGAAGTLPLPNNWNIITGDIGVNNELQVYRRDPKNIARSGGDTLQIIPYRDASALRGWTSGRIESSFVFTPQPGRLTRAEAAIRFGNNGIARKQGIWPAFWLLGDVLRRGGSWPDCGEIDILETVNGRLTGHGTVHCDVFPGGICNEGTGIGSTIAMPDQGWHTWRVQLDRRPGNWQDQSITWFMDGQQFHRVTGARIGNANVWARLCHSPLYFILNVAVGGTFPGNPNDQTLGGVGSMMEVGYVALYNRG